VSASTHALEIQTGGRGWSCAQLGARMQGWPPWESRTTLASGLAVPCTPHTTRTPPVPAPPHAASRMRRRLGDYSLLPQARLSRGLAHVSSEYAHVCGMLADRRLVVTRYVLFVASIRVATEAARS